MSRILVFVVILTASNVAIAQDQSSQADQTLVGLWGAERVFAPARPLDIALEQHGDEIRAYAAGQVAEVTVDEERLSFEFNGGLGQFRGQRNRRDSSIEGHWISTPGPMAYQPYASPVILESQSNKRWGGQHIPIEQTFSVYISVSRGDDGTLQAFMRNPERNQGRFTRLSTVQIEGDRVAFLNTDNDEVLSGQLNDEVLSVYFPWRGGSYDLTKRERNEASGFFPRMTQERYQYQVPVNREDGWRVGAAKDLGLETRVLEELVQSILDTEVTSIRAPYIHSLLIARQGKLVLEEYFYGHHRSRTHDLRSATKSVTGLMTGNAIAEIEDLSVDSQVYSLISNASSNTSPYRDQLNVEHLLAMQTGFACDDNDYNSPGSEDRMQEQTTEMDWYRFTLALDFVAKPGSKAVYCSGGINLLGGIISEQTNVWLPEFFRTRLAQPMNINQYYYNLDPMGRGYGGGGIQMRPRDFLKFGQLLIDQGKWNKKQVVSRDWIEQSIQAHASINEKDDYGYAWWRFQMPYKDRVVAAYSAGGNGGQLLIIVPELDLVVGFTGGNYGDFRTWSAWRDQLVPEKIFSGIKD